MKRLSNNLTLVVLFVVAVVGLADASYLTYEHYTGNKVVCSITGGCEKVLTREYSTVFGVPISLGGIIFYLAVLGFAFHFLLQPIDKRATQLLLAMSTVGLLTSAYLTGLQAFVIRAWCQFCLLSAFTSLCIFLLSIALYRKGSRADKKEEKNDEKS